MPVSVSDARANANELIDHVVEVLGRSAHRLAVFKAIYRGGRTKSVAEVAKVTRLSRQRVLQEGGRLVATEVVTKARKDNDTAYTKDKFIAAHRDKILSLVKNPKKRAKFPTKRRPQVPTSGATVRVQLPRKQVQVRALTIDDIDSFKKVRGVESRATAGDVYESRIKKGVKTILGEVGKFTDWGGEGSDLFTTRLRIDDKRLAAAFAFKGRGTKGVLVPGKLGKNGDQIQRLFQTEARVFVVQFGGQVADSVYKQMVMAATARSYTTGDKVFYAVIDGQDTARLMKAYPAAFRAPRHPKR